MAITHHLPRVCSLQAWDRGNKGRRRGRAALDARLRRQDLELSQRQDLELSSPAVAMRPPSYDDAVHTHGNF